MRPSPTATNPLTGDLQVLIFGPQAHSVGADRVSVTNLHFPITAGELMVKIAAVCPVIAGSLGVSRIAINHEFATADCSIEFDDEVALIGLISGG